MSGVVAATIISGVIAAPPAVIVNNVGRRGHTPPNPSHAGGGVELLGDRHERDAAAVKDLDELGKIEERARSLLQSRHQQL
jgi:hypothetical protein